MLIQKIPINLFQEANLIKLNQLKLCFQTWGPRSLSKEMKYTLPTPEKTSTMILSWVKPNKGQISVKIQWE